MMELDDEGGKLGIGSGISPNWTELTRECLLEILSRLSLEQRCLGPMLVCKTWMKACKDPLLNSVFDLETQSLSIPESVSWWSPEFEDKVDSVLQSVVDWSQGGLKKIQVRHCSDRSLSYVAERCPNLEVLWIKYSPSVTDASIVKIALNCPKLRELDISYSYGISHESLTMVGMNCPNMEILKRNLYSWMCLTAQTTPFDYLDSFPNNVRMEPGVIARFMPQLKHLELQFSTLDAEGLALVCEGCPKLEYLDLYGCINMQSSDITAITSSLKNLKEIKLQPMIERSTCEF